MKVLTHYDMIELATRIPWKGIWEQNWGMQHYLQEQTQSAV